MKVLQTQALRKIYGAGDTEVRALDGVDLAVEIGEFVAVVGTSGSGKSTLLHMLGGLDRPTGGKVYVDGNDIFALKDDELTIFRRRRIGFVFQAYNLVPVLSVYENIVLPIELDGGTVDRAYVDEIIRTLGWKASCPICPASFRAASNSAWPSPARSPPSPPSSWRTSRPATWTAKPARTCSRCSR